jgi:glycine/D-amino acid oxidase-like deaminating enzyme
MRRAWTRELEDQKAIFERLSLPYEVLKPEEMAKRYPQVGFEGVGIGFLDMNAGLLKAREAIMAITETFERAACASRTRRATAISSSTATPATTTCGLPAEDRGTVSSTVRWWASTWPIA